MKKELRPVHEDVACDICGRTILKGERTEPYLAPGGQRMLVCDLCTDRAYAEGWIRESAHGETPASLSRREPRRSILGRLRRRGPAAPAAPAVEAGPGSDGASDGLHDADGLPPLRDLEPEPEPYAEAAPPDAPPPPPPPSRPKDPRHVRAVPTNAQVKVERAVEVFNASEHPRTIAGIARSLGEPWVTATPLEASPSEVSIVVAWELSWYHYRVDLGTEHDPVTLIGKGEELDELEPWAKEWNASASGDGSLAIGIRSQG
ncbi:MAG TPA: hypothetical protein VF517_01865 [Thermoleophilaceae bacterium]|jgi:hypothetical protein